MYLLHAPKEKFGILPPATALFTADIRFTNNYAFTPNYYWRKIHLQKGCIDISAKSLEKLRRKKNYRKVLFRTSSAIGDTLWVMAAIKAFKEKHPQCQIFVQTEAALSCLWKHCQFIAGHIKEETWSSNQIMASMENVYDFGGVATVYKDQMKLDPIEAIFKQLDLKIPKESSRLRPDITMTAEEGEQAIKKLEEYGINARESKIITLGLDASTANRDYPFEYFKVISEGLINEGYKVIWFASKPKFYEEFLKEKDKIKGVVNLSGKTKLRESMAIIKIADLHINPNSGLMVISTAFNVPTIGLFGAFKPKSRAKHYEKFIGLYEPEPCSPCENHWTECPKGHPAKCMLNITPSLVLNACKELLTKYPRTPIEKLPIE